MKWGIISHLAHHRPRRPQWPATGKQQRLDATLDKLRARYGRKVIYYGGVQESRDSAPMRIAFTHVPDAGVEGD